MAQNLIPRRRVVVSAVNLHEGGPLTVLQDCLAAAASTLPAEWEIFAIVHRSGVVTEPRVQCVEFPKARRSWGRRLVTEWFLFDGLSRELRPDLWFSLHDITPNVHVKRRAVYCHNPAPFYKLTWKEALLEPKLQLFSWFYGYLYKINMDKNRFVVVQQDWLRAALGEVGAGVSVVVAYPSTGISRQSLPSARTDPARHVFLYPALPRVFKNFEVLCEAAAQLSDGVGGEWEIRLTIDGSENRYSRHLRRRYGGLPNVSFIGRQSREQMIQQYADADVVCFPSKLETWGLPITEAKSLRKPLLVADLPYAHETVGRYDSVVFLPTGNPGAWAQAMRAAIEGRLQFAGSESAQPAQPFAAGWPELWRILAEGL